MYVTIGKQPISDCNLKICLSVQLIAVGFVESFNDSTISRQNINTNFRAFLKWVTFCLMTQRSTEHVFDGLTSRTFLTKVK